VSLRCALRFALASYNTVLHFQLLLQLQHKLFLLVQLKDSMIGMKYPHSESTAASLTAMLYMYVSDVQLCGLHRK
jgi:hypothetical protein